jgi:ubiquinone biosynthesis protein
MDAPAGPRRDEGPRKKVRRAIDKAVRRHHAAKAGDPGPEAGLDDPLSGVLDDPLSRVWTSDAMQVSNFVDFGGATAAPGVIAQLPRRGTIGKPSDQAAASPPMAQSVDFSASLIVTSGRLFIWLYGALRLILGNGFESLRGRATVKSRAVRLRETLEMLGPTFIKLGQQLSVRADVLPYEYCAELAKMLDRVPPFPSEIALATVERNLGRKVTEVFQIFDPNPIGSASLACVYQAYLRSGHKVAVKVRRPAIVETLAADIRAMSWILWLAELSSLIRPGLTRNLIRELRDMLTEELDFGREARFTEIFRQRTKDEKLRFLTAPQVYRELSNQEVMVSEFVHGVFLWEILNAMDTHDEEALAAIRARDISPEQVARNMAELFNWESMESPLFHADPHPANIVIRPGNTICMIDFGSCGRFSSKVRRLFHQLHYYMNAEDVRGMVECSISMLEPLPPIDIDRFQKEIEALYWEQLYASKDRHSEWWEKASGVLWIRFAAIAQRFNIPIALDTLRLFRATFLYDTVMFRLWKDLDLDTEYQRYFKKLGRRSRRRIEKAVRRRLWHGPTNKDYRRIEDMERVGNQILGRLQHFLDTPQHNFASVIGKAAFGVTMFLRIGLFVSVVHIVVVVAVTMWSTWTEAEISMWQAFTWLVGSQPYQLGMLVLGLVVIRKALMRFEDIDVGGG